MKRRHIIPEEVGSRKGLHRIAGATKRVLAAAVVAFSAQYGDILGGREAQAATKEEYVQELPPALQQLDHDVILADPARTLRGGVVTIGPIYTPAVTMRGPEDGKWYCGASIYLPGVHESALQQMAMALECPTKKVSNAATKTFYEYMERSLNAQPYSLEEQQKLRFGLITLFGRPHTNGYGTRDRRHALADVIAEFRKLDDGSAWFQERLRDAEIMTATDRANTAKVTVNDPEAQRMDMLAYTNQQDYVHQVLRAVEIQNSRTEVYLKGEMPRSEYLMGVVFFATMTGAHIDALTKTAERGWFHEKLYEWLMPTVGPVYKALQAASDALGDETAFPYAVQAHQKYDMARQLLEYQAFLGANSHSYPGVTAEQMMNAGYENHRVATALLEQYGTQKLFLQETEPERLQLANQNMQKHFPAYLRLANAASTAERLRDLFAQVQKKQGGWSVQDKKRLVEIYEAAVKSPSLKAQEEFLSVLREGIQVSTVQYGIKRYEETGKTHDFPNSPRLIRDRFGEERYTTEHPVDMVEAEFTLTNTLPVPVRFAFEVQVDRLADNEKEVHEIYLPANKIADVTYRGAVSVVDRRDHKLYTNLNIAFNGFQIQEVATSTGGEQIASAR